MGRAASTAAGRATHLGDLSFNPPCSKGPGGLPAVTVPAGYGRTGAGRKPGLASGATWAWPFDADARLAP
jgi:hypothetical protein